MGALGGLIRPATDLASKAVKADKVKSVKLKVKVKMKGGAVEQNGSKGPANLSGT